MSTVAYTEDKKMQVIGYSEDKDAFYYFNDKDEMVCFPIDKDYRKATWNFLSKIKNIASSVAYSSAMDFEFPDTYGKEARDTFDGIFGTVYNKKD